MGEIELLALAERVEKLEGPCRETDARIWCALRGVKYQGYFEAYGSSDTRVEYTEPPKRTRMVSQGRPHSPDAAPVTASLDAAMTLVPEGWGWQATFRPDGDGCDGMVWGSGDFSPTLHAEAATPALALCAAALRSRASITRTTGDGDGNG